MSGSGNLVNRNGKWQYSKKKWILPKENQVGHIKDDSSTKVLVLKECNTETALVELEDCKSFDLEGKSQGWLRGPTNRDGWFKLIKIESFLISKKVLTAHSTTETTVTGTYFFSIL